MDLSMSRTITEKGERMPPSQNFILNKPSAKLVPRTVMSIEGPGKGGKSRLALNHEAETLYLPFDIRWREEYEKLLAEGRRIYLPKGGAYDQVFATGIPVDSKDKVQDDRKSTSKPVWDRFLKDLKQGAADGFRWMVVDTASEAFATYLSAEYGKTSSIPQHMWGPMYFGFGNALRSAIVGNPKCNLLLIHQLKDEYKDTPLPDGSKASKKTGNLIADQCKKMEFFIDTTIRCNYDQEAKMFTAEIKICSPNMDLCGQVFQVEKDNGFLGLAAEMFGARFDPADWE
jgi:hypothetical protein